MIPMKSLSSVNSSLSLTGGGPDPQAAKPHNSSSNISFDYKSNTFHKTLTTDDLDVLHAKFSSGRTINTHPSSLTGDKDQLQQQHYLPNEGSFEAGGSSVLSSRSNSSVFGEAPADYLLHEDPKRPPHSMNSPRHS